MNSISFNTDSVPVLPELANHVLRMALDEDASLVKLSGVIENDQALTARILSLANSSYYKRSRTVYTVRDAVVVMGIEGVKTMSLGLCVLDMFPPVAGSPMDYKGFWRHSIACAIYARAMMTSVNESLASRAFCAGLLHDIGKLVLDQCLGAEYHAVLEIARGGSRALVEIEKERLGTTHAEVGRDLLLHWNLPALYAESVWCHHAPLKILDEEQLSVSGIVHIANILTHMTFIGSSGNHFPQRITNSLLRKFNLRPELMDSLMPAVAQEIDTICDDIGVGGGNEGIFRLVNRASMRLFDTFMALRERTQGLEASERRANILVRLLRELNQAARITEALEKSAGLLMEEGLASGFLGGLKAGEHNLVFEARRDESARFLRATDDELKGMLVAGDYPAGTRLPGGIFVYLDVEDKDLDHDFLAALIDAIAAALRRIYIEDKRREDEAVLRQALAGAAAEKQKAEDMLALTQEMVDVSKVGLCLVDENGLVRIENEQSAALRAMMGIEGEQVLAALSESESEPLGTIRAALQARASADAVWEQAGRAVIKLVVRPVAANSWTMLTMWDITLDLAQQRRMVSYAKMSAVGNLAASMAHNMKSPLGALQGFANIILDDLRSGRIRVNRGANEDGDFQDMIANMLTASENALAIVNQLMTLTKKWESPSDDTDLERLAADIFRVVEPQAAAAGVILRRDLRAGRAHIKSQALEQALINLLMNAVAASSAGQEVRLLVEADADGLRLAVSDDGIGMSGDQVERIFDPLYTNWPSKTGMGLGLALARDIVESMDGRIEVSSQPGEGSTFSVHIPEIDSP